VRRGNASQHTEYARTAPNEFVHLSPPPKHDIGVAPKGVKQMIWSQDTPEQNALIRAYILTVTSPDRDIRGSRQVPSPKISRHIRDPSGTI
jgi:hypothetical protein